MEYMTYNYLMKFMIYGLKYELILNMLLYLVESTWRNAHSIRFFKIRAPFGFLFFLGGGGGGGVQGLVFSNSLS